MDTNQVRAALRDAVGTNQSAWARQHNISPQYVTDVLNERREPGPSILDALGIEKLISYRSVA